MTRYQRAKRFAFWRGLVAALVVFTGYIFALGLADRITSG
jgi:hypothetical protein